MPMKIYADTGRTHAQGACKECGSASFMLAMAVTHRDEGVLCFCANCGEIVLAAKMNGNHYPALTFGVSAKALIDNAAKEPTT
jgi:hypothetical protein